MRILGFNIKISLLLMMIQAESSVKVTTFPENSSFGDQVDFVEQLPPTCSAITSNTMKDFINSANPFALLSTMSGNAGNVKTTIHRHENKPELGIILRRTAS